MRSNIITSREHFIKQVLQGHVGQHGSYSVPIYQRPFTWEKDKVEALFYDFSNHLKSGSDFSYYLGNLVFVNGPNSLEILDGQQRLTTLYLFIVALELSVKSIESELNDESRLLTTDLKSRLELQITELKDVLDKHCRREDGRFINFHYEEDEEVFKFCLSRNFSIERISTSGRKKHHLITKCIVTFISCIDTYLRENATDADATVYDYLQNKLNIINNFSSFIREQGAEVTITVIHEGLEFSIFETLNNRGEELNIYDLTRNIMINISGKPHINNRAQVEKDFDKTIRKNCFDVRTNRYKVSLAKSLILGNWNMRFKGKITVGAYMKLFTYFVNKGDVELGGGFGKRGPKSKENFEETHETLKTSSIAFRELLQPSKIAQPNELDLNISFDRPSELTTLSERIKRFSDTNFKQFYPVYFALRNKNANAKLLDKYIHMMEVIYVKMIFTYESSPSSIENYISDMSTEIFHSQNLDETYLEHKEQVIEKIEALPGSDDFEEIFSKRSSLKNNVSRYFLKKFEHHLFNVGSSNSPNIQETNEVEHILPKKYTTHWKDVIFIDQDTKLDDALHDKYINRLGNLTLLDKRTNIENGNASYEIKKRKYDRDKYSITNYRLITHLPEKEEYHHKNISVNHYDSWNAVSIEKRQKMMARIATEIWNL